MKDTVSAPITLPSDYSILHSNLGTFWIFVIDDTEFVEYLMYSKGLLSEQLTQNFTETLNMVSRDTVSIYHRERWHPIVVRQSEKGKGKATLLKIGMDPPVVFGPQPVTTEYEYMAVYTIGGNVVPGGYVSYPIRTGATKSLSYICNKIMSPDLILISGVDYIVKEDTILFKKDKDPFIANKYSTRTMIENDVLETDAVLWATDILVDKDFIYNNFGYAIALKMESSEYYLNIVNAVWDGLAEGSRTTNFNQMVASALNIQSIRADGEIIEEFLIDEYSQDKLMITDKNVYRYNPRSEFKPYLRIGSVLTMHDIPIDTVRVYSSVSTQRPIDSDFSLTKFKEDVPSLYMSKNLLRCAIKYGLIFNWDVTPVYFVGTDANGHAKLWFRLGGSEEDLGSFWNNVWTSFETNNVDPAVVFAKYFNTDMINELEKEYRPPKSSDFKQYDLTTRATYPLMFLAPGAIYEDSGVIVNNWRYTLVPSATYKWEAYNMSTGLFFNPTSPLVEFTTAAGSATYLVGLIAEMSEKGLINFFANTTISDTTLHLIDPASPSITLSLYTQTNNSILVGSKLEAGKIDQQFSSENMLVGSIKPIEFLLDNFLSTNVTFIVIDSAKLDANLELTVLSRLRDFIPAHAYAIIILKQTVTGEEYEFEVSASDTVKLKMAEDSEGNLVDVYGSAIEPFPIAIFNDMCYYNSINVGVLTYRDNKPVVKIIPDCIRR